MNVPELHAFFDLVLFSPYLVPLVVVWSLAMIALPIVSMVAPRYRATTVTVAVIAQALVVSFVLLSSLPPVTAVTIIVLVPLLGWSAEFVGSRTGIPFGTYDYTDLLQPQIGRVPIAIPLAWLMMMPPAWAIAAVIVPNGPPVLRAVVAALAFTAWDFYLDPQMVGWDYWRWQKPGAYVGIPIVNFVGWFIWSFVISFALGNGAFRVEPLILVFLTHWILQFGGHLVFWKMPVSAIVGFLAMGATAIPAMWIYFF